jgi:TolA-binding protein
VVFSRTVRATVGQLVEVPFRGTGWVYLGELASRRGIAYHSRRLDPEGQSFIFRAEAAGTYALKFYKQDFIRDYILNDHVQVIVGEAPEAAATGWFNPPVDRGRVIAEPRWPTIAEEAEVRRKAEAPSAPADRGAAGAASDGGTAGRPASPRPDASGTALPAEAVRDAPPIAETPTDPARDGSEEAVRDGSTGAAEQAPESALAAEQVPGTAPSAGQSLAENVPTQELPHDVLPETYMQRARDEFDAGRVSAALDALNQFRERFPSGSDEAYWLYGQFYEANSPNRDIRTALDYYRRLINEYPQSPRYDDARRRIVYLERYYINIQ